MKPPSVIGNRAGRMKTEWMSVNWWKEEERWTSAAALVETLPRIADAIDKSQSTDGFYGSCLSSAETLTACLVQISAGIHSFAWLESTLPSRTFPP